MTKEHEIFSFGVNRVEHEPRRLHLEGQEGGCYGIKFSPGSSSMSIRWNVQSVMPSWIALAYPGGPMWAWKALMARSSELHADSEACQAC